MGKKQQGHFKRTEEGYIVYKTFGAYYTPPEKWVIEPGTIIEEDCNKNRDITCAAGINFSTETWILNFIPHYDCMLIIWKCLIRKEWLDGVTVPYLTDGKARCSKLQLIEICHKEEPTCKSLMTTAGSSGGVE